MLPQANVGTYLPQIFWLIIAFGLLYWLIHKFIAPLIDNILFTRQKTIDDDVNNASILTEEISVLKSSYELSLKEVHEQAENIKFNSLHQLGITYEKQKLELMKELDKLKADNISQIEENINAFTLSQDKYVIDLAKVIIEKIIHLPADEGILTQCYKNII